MIVKEIRKYLTTNKIAISAFLLSLSIHLLILFFPKINTTEPPTPKSNEPIAVELKDKSDDFLEEDTMTEQGYFPCPNSYVGVGFKYWILTGEISELSPGSPAQKAGLLPGDIIQSMTNSANLKVGDDFSITVLRNYQIVTFTITMEDICTK